MNIQPSDYKECGLYLIFPDGKSLTLTHSMIEERSAAILANPELIPQHVKDAEEFQLCSICPKHGTPGETCHAIRPILAFWENIDEHLSYTQVTAVYRGSSPNEVMIAETTMQRALQYLSIMSLMYYCETGKKYWKYFYGVHPLMSTEDVVIRVYMNMFWMCEGNIEKTRALITKFHDEITTTTRCQLGRIRLFCKHDAFLNALVLTQLASEFLAMNAEDVIRRHVASFDKSFSL